MGESAPNERQAREHDDAELVSPVGDGRELPIDAPPVATKRRRGCGRVKPLEEFPRDSKDRDGRQQSPCDDGYIRDVGHTNDTARSDSYPRPMSRTGREHTMKRILVTLGVTAAMALAPSVASAGTSSNASPQRQTRPPESGFFLRISTDSRSGHTVYRIGNSGLWME